MTPLSASDGKRPDSVIRRQKCREKVIEMDLDTFKEQFRVTPIIVIKVGGTVVSKTEVAAPKGVSGKAFELLNKSFGKDLDCILKQLKDDPELEADIDTDTGITLRVRAKGV